MALVVVVVLVRAEMGKDITLTLIPDMGTRFPYDVEIHEHIFLYVRRGVGVRCGGCGVNAYLFRCVINSNSIRDRIARRGVAALF